MRTTLIFLSAILLMPLIIFAQYTKYDDVDPLMGNYVVGNNAEIQFVFLTTSPYQIRGFSYDWEKKTSNLTPNKKLGDYNVLPQFDMDTGDFNGDLHDDCVVVSEYPRNTVLLAISDYRSSKFLQKSLGDSGELVAPEGSAILRVTAGNFDRDPQKEIAVAYFNHTSGKIKIGLYETDSAMTEIRVLDEIEDLDLEVIRPGEAFDPYWLRFDIAAGDYDGDGLDEVALVKYKFIEVVDDKYSFCAKMYDITDNSLHTEADTDTIEVEASKSRLPRRTDGLVIASTNLDDKYWDDEVLLGYTKYKEGDYESSVITYWKPGEDPDHKIERKEASGDMFVRNNKGTNTSNVLNLVCADLNMDGKDEIVMSSCGRLTSIIECNNLKFEQLGNDINLWNSWVPADKYYGSQFITVADLDADTSDVDVSDESAQWLPEIVAFRPDLGEIKIFQPQLDESNNVTGLTEIDKQSFDQDMQQYDKLTFAIAPADMDGDALRLGKPRNMLVESVIERLLILNAPPAHFDYFGDQPYDICEIYGANAEQEKFMTVYGLETGKQTSFQHKTHKNWGVSAELSAGYSAFGCGAKARFKAEYGQNFNKTTAETKFMKETKKSTAKIDDEIFANRMDYGLWEYPVYYRGERYGEFLVTLPHRIGPIWFPAKSEESGRYFQSSHEPGNILSYPQFEKPEDNPDVGSLVAEGDWVSLRTTSHQWGIQTGNESETIDESEWHLNMSFSVSTSSPFHSSKYSAKYGQSEITTHALKISKDIYFESFLGSICQDFQNNAQYRVKPFIYKSKAGSLVLDYLVSPDTSSGGTGNFWVSNYGDKPDLSFNLPWKYDKEKGVDTEEYYRNRTKEIIITPRYPSPGDTVEIKAIIHNYSLKDAQNTVTVNFYIGDPDAGGSPITSVTGETEVTVYNGIEARAYREVKMQWQVPSDISSKPLIYAVVDRENKIDEVHEDGSSLVNNNKGWVELEMYKSTGIDKNNLATQPLKYELYQNYPNPFNPSTNIEFTLPLSENVQIDVYNVLGRKVKTLLDRQMAAGAHRIEFVASDFASGMYFYRIQAGSFQQVKKMLLLK